MGDILSAMWSRWPGEGASARVVWRTVCARAGVGGDYWCRERRGARISAELGNLVGIALPHDGGATSWAGLQKVVGCDLLACTDIGRGGAD